REIEARQPHELRRRQRLDAALFGAADQLVERPPRRLALAPEMETLEAEICHRLLPSDEFALLDQQVAVDQLHADALRRHVETVNTEPPQALEHDGTLADESVSDDRTRDGVERVRRRLDRGEQVGI